MTKLSKTKRAAMIMLPCLLCAAMASCAAIPSFIRSIPPPLEETEPWAHAISQAKKAAQREGEHFVRRHKQAQLRGGKPNTLTFSKSSRNMSMEEFWHREKRKWLQTARRKGFTGPDSAVEPEWLLEYKQNID